jgi:hypothetical protein
VKSNSQNILFPIYTTKYYSHFNARVISHDTASFSRMRPSPIPSLCLLQLTTATMNLSFSSEEGYIACSSWKREQKSKKKLQEQFLILKPQFQSITKLSSVCPHNQAMMRLRYLCLSTHVHGHKYEHQIFDVMYCSSIR